MTHEERIQELMDKKAINRKDATYMIEIIDAQKDELRALQEKFIRDMESVSLYYDKLIQNHFKNQ